MSVSKDIRIRTNYEKEKSCEALKGEKDYKEKDRQKKNGKEVSSPLSIKKPVTEVAGFLFVGGKRGSRV